MTLHRFFLPVVGEVGNRVDFPENVARQIRTVLRLQPGDTVVVLDGSCKEYIVQLESVRHDVYGSVQSHRLNTAEPHIRVVLYQGLLKSSKLDWVLQKGTEIGISRFVPMRTEHSIPAETSPSRQTRYETIVREASEQSRRGRVPVVCTNMVLQNALEFAASQGDLVILWEGETGMTMDTIKLAPGVNEIGLFVGPEGGFSPREVEIARTFGAQCVTLGPRILRAETAGIVGAALLLYELERRTRIQSFP
ncbi:MAG: 16S rRNA (uracil(1498)-N(3))-methyltransferase [Chloroflexota bacterium]